MRILIAGAGVGGLTPPLPPLRHRIQRPGYKKTAPLEGGATVQGDPLIGGDGVHSRSRQALLGADQPEFTGTIAWRGIVPMERLPRFLVRRRRPTWAAPGPYTALFRLRAGKLMNFVGV